MSKITIFDALNLQNRKSGDIGLEIEVEGYDLPQRVGAKWQVTTDGSLKGEGQGLEYVLREPTNIAGVTTACNDLARGYRSNESRVLKSDFAGVHVHINVQKLSVKQMYTFVTCYYVLEELLMEYCGENRKGNHFCLRAKDAEYVLLKLSEAATSGDLHRLRTDDIRYSALNLLSLFSYGSIEFRAMRSTQDFDKIINWAGMLLSIRDSSMQFNDPSDVLSTLKSGEDSFLNMVLPQHRHLFKDVDFVSKIKTGRRLIQPMAYMTDWSKYRSTSLQIFDMKGYYNG